DYSIRYDSKVTDQKAIPGSLLIRFLRTLPSNSTNSTLISQLLPLVLILDYHSHNVSTRSMHRTLFHQGRKPCESEFQLMDGLLSPTQGCWKVEKALIFYFFPETALFPGVLPAMSSFFLGFSKAQGIHQLYSYVLSIRSRGTK